MNASRLILLLVAIVAGGAMAFFVVEDEPQTQVVQAPSEIKVLVAKQAIGPGEALRSAIVEWQSWPEKSVRPEFVTNRNLPDAPAQLDGVVARFEIFPGEPLTQAKLIRSSDGYLSAVVGPGMRAVAIEVDTKQAAGGLIVPNDHVDVIFVSTRTGDGNAKTIVSNVRVLAINHQVGEVAQGRPLNEQDDQERVFTTQSNATLEVTPAQAEIIAFSNQAGALSLALRSIVDSGEQAGKQAGKEDVLNGQVRLIGYGVTNAFNTTTLKSQESDQNEPRFVVDEPIFSASGEPGAPQSRAPEIEPGQTQGVSDPELPPFDLR